MTDDARWYVAAVSAWNSTHACMSLGIKICPSYFTNEEKYIGPDTNLCKYIYNKNKK
jgi:hypothetical protein